MARLQSKFQNLNAKVNQMQTTDWQMYIINHQCFTILRKSLIIRQIDGHSDTHTDARQSDNNRQTVKRLKCLAICLNCIGRVCMILCLSQFRISVQNIWLSEQHRRVMHLTYSFNSYVCLGGGLQNFIYITDLARLLTMPWYISKLKSR